MSISGKLTIAFWAIFLVVVGAIIAMFVGINNGSFGHLPPVEELQSPKNKFATEIFSCDGVVLGRYFQSSENRVFTAYEDISPNLVNALIATEDIRFKEHSGIDFKSLFRAIFKSDRKSVV